MVDMVKEFKIEIRMTKRGMDEAKKKNDWATYNGLERKLNYLKERLEYTKKKFAKQAHKSPEQHMLLGIFFKEKSYETENRERRGFLKYMFNLSCLYFLDYPTLYQVYLYIDG